MVCKGIKVDLVAYKALICSSCRIGKASEAKSLMEEMLKSDILPDPQICRALIQCYQIDLIPLHTISAFRSNASVTLLYLQNEWINSL
ncbi:hypothetical protein V6N12_036274 [Hibiscus sabdariffa]|uniref:Pentatricopeptide repeat-containing protein n=1 Tax=Hibiscus sabdariffa TaxID=183260 RepID=A0ABR2EQ43_9ROSI